MKKIVLIFSGVLLLVSCKSSKEVSSDKIEKNKVETTVKSPSPDRDSRGNYLK